MYCTRQISTSQMGLLSGVIQDLFGTHYFYYDDLNEHMNNAKMFSVIVDGFFTTSFSKKGSSAWVAKQIMFWQNKLLMMSLVKSALVSCLHVAVIIEVYPLPLQASENLIVPLLAMVGELNRRQRELVKIISAKDKEIDDYKSQGVKTSRSMSSLHISNLWE